MGCGCTSCVCGKKGQKAEVPFEENSKLGILILGFMIIAGALYFLT